MTMPAKDYSTAVRTDSGYDAIPSKVSFSIDELTARSIVALARVVKENDLYKVERFDYRASWLELNHERRGELMGEGATPDEVSTGAEILNVSESEFWFGAYLKHTNVEVLSERMPIAELVSYFEINEETTLHSQSQKAAVFVSQVAQLSRWGMGTNNVGRREDDCLEPAEGFLDSHCYLMDLIEQARDLVRDANC